MAFLFRSSSTPRLAVSVTEQAMTFAWAGASSRSTEPLALPAGWPNASPDQIGALVREHLQRHGGRRSAGAAVAVGLSARSLLARRIPMPTTEPTAVAGIVRLKVEREFAGGLRDLAFDYALAPASTGEQGVLLIGARSDRLAHLQAIFAAAGLKVQSITATAVAVAEVQAPPPASPRSRPLAAAPVLVAVLEADGLSLLVRDAGRCLAMNALSGRFDPKHLVGAAAEHLVSDLTRSASLLGMGPQVPLQMLDTLPLSPEAVENLLATLRQRRAEVEWLPVGAAAALLGGTRDRHRRESPRIDLSRQRLVAPPPRRLGPWATGGLAVALLLLLATGGLAYFWIEGGRELESLRRAEVAVRPAATQLETVRGQTRQAAGWFDQRPALLETLLALTETFPTRGRIWVTQLSISSETDAPGREGRGTGPLRGSLKCQAEDKDTMLAYLQAMQQSLLLSDVELRDWSSSGQDGRLVRFEIAFLFVPQGQGGV